MSSPAPAAWPPGFALRSAYLLYGTARWRRQRSVAPTPALRYSITFRTPRGTGLAGASGTSSKRSSSP